MNSFPATFPQPVALHGVVVPQLQDPILVFVKAHTVGLCHPAYPDPFAEPSYPHADHSAPCPRLPAQGARYPENNRSYNLDCFEVQLATSNN